MADFCKQCSIQLFGKDFRELAGLRTEEMKEQNSFPVVICEGCGHTLVDEDGTCVDEDCLKRHDVDYEEPKGTQE